MAMKSGFYNSKDGDRKYNAADLNQPYKRIISNGVVPVPGNSLQVTAVDGMAIQVEAGFGIFGDGWAENDAPVTLTLNAAHSTLNRKDLIVVRRDDSESVRTTDFYVKTGTPATNPVAPTLERSAYIKEYALAEVYVGKGVQSIEQSKITDTRADSARCGWCTSLIQQVDTSTLFLQWQKAYENAFNENQDDFDLWFSNIKETLATSTLIRQYTSTYTATENGTTVIPIDINQYNKNLDILYVYVNGWQLVYDVDYTANDTHITLNKPINAGTIVNKQILKSIDGSDAETVINEVVELQNKVAALENNVYYCNGANDNVGLKEFINLWLLGSPTKDTIEIVGRFGCNASKTTASDGNSYSFVYESAEKQGLTLDFSKCEVVAGNGNFMFVNGVRVIKCSVLYDNTLETIAFGSQESTFKECYVYGKIGNGFGFKGNKTKYIDCKVDLNASGAITGINCTNSVLTDCEIIVKSATVSAYGCEISAESRAEGCTFRGITEATGTTTSGNGAIGGGYFSNCLFEGFGGLKGHGAYVRAAALFNVSNCIFRGYTKDSSNGLGVGITGAADAGTTVLLLGINCNQVAATGYTQTGSVSFANAYGIIMGMFYAGINVPETITQTAVFNRNRV